MATRTSLGIMSREWIQKYFEKWFSNHGMPPNVALTEESTLENLGITEEVIAAFEKHQGVLRRRLDPRQPDEAIVKGAKNALSKEWTYGRLVDLLCEDHLDNI